MRTLSVTRQSELVEALAKYEADMTMIGDQYFKCYRNIFSVPNKISTMEFTHDNHLGSQNMVMVFVMGARAYLSPYTSWKFGFKLYDKPFRRAPFEDGQLHKFADDEIDT